jgi:hypothetical protein
MMKMINDLVKIKEAIESKFSRDDIKKAENHFRKKAMDSQTPYITYLRVIGQADELSAITRLLGLYLLYVK